MTSVGNGGSAYSALSGSVFSKPLDSVAPAASPPLGHRGTNDTTDNGTRLRMRASSAAIPVNIPPSGSHVPGRASLDFRASAGGLPSVPLTKAAAQLQQDDLQQDDPELTQQQSIEGAGANEADQSYVKGHDYQEFLSLGERTSKAAAHVFGGEVAANVLEGGGSNYVSLPPDPQPQKGLGPGDERSASNTGRSASNTERSASNTGRQVSDTKSPTTESRTPNAERGAFISKQMGEVEKLQRKFGKDERELGKLTSDLKTLEEKVAGLKKDDLPFQELFGQGKKFAKEIKNLEAKIENLETKIAKLEAKIKPLTDAKLFLKGLMSPLEGTVYASIPGAEEGTVSAPIPGAEGSPGGTSIGQSLEQKFGQIKKASVPQDMIEELGRGAFGVVCKGVVNREVVAIKFPLESDAEAVEDFRAEAVLHASIPPHPNVVELRGVSGDPLAAVTEFCSEGNMKSFMESDRFKNMDPSDKLKLGVKLTKDIAAGMAHLAKQGIAHRDLARRNVLIHEHPPGTFTAKIADFGRSKVLDDNGTHVTEKDTGPLKWMAPEEIRFKESSEASDVWAFATTLLEIFSGQEPYPELVAVQAATAIMREGISPGTSFQALTFADETLGIALKSLVSDCSSHEAGDRPTFAAINARLNSPPFTPAA